MPQGRGSQGTQRRPTTRTLPCPWNNGEDDLSLGGRILSCRIGPPRDQEWEHWYLGPQPWRRPPARTSTSRAHPSQTSRVGEHPAGYSRHGVGAASLPRPGRDRDRRRAPCSRPHGRRDARDGPTAAARATVLSRQLGFLASSFFFFFFRSQLVSIASGLADGVGFHRGRVAHLQLEAEIAEDGRGVQVR